MGYRELYVGPGGTDYIEIAGGWFYADFYHSGDDMEFATTAYVSPEWIPVMKERLSASLRLPIATDDELLDALADRFGDSPEIKKWLTANGIPFAYRYDDGARYDPLSGPSPEPPPDPPLGPRLRVIA